MSPTKVLHASTKRKRSNLEDSVSPKKQKTNSSLLELCEREEWDVIIDSMQDLIHFWDFSERNAVKNTPIHICCTKGSLHVLKQLKHLKNFEFSKESKGKNGNSYVLLAAENGHLETIKWLLENGSSINERNNSGYSCLLLAARNGHLETIKWLIANGCSINEKDNYGTCVTCCREWTFRNNKMVGREWMLNKRKE